MAPTLLSRDYYDDDNSVHSYTTTIIIVIVVILVIKICLIIGICYWRSKKRAERRAKGCHCFDDSDYWCLPWWYWSSNSRCHCGAYNNGPYNSIPYTTPYNGPYNNGPPPPAYNNPQYNVGPQSPLYSAQPAAQNGAWNANSTPFEMKPPAQGPNDRPYYS